MLAGRVVGTASHSCNAKKGAPYSLLPSAVVVEPIRSVGRESEKSHVERRFSRSSLLQLDAAPVNAGRESFHRLSTARVSHSRSIRRATSQFLDVVSLCLPRRLSYRNVELL
jgi:hypothetical protein